MLLASVVDIIFSAIIALLLADFLAAGPISPGSTDVMESLSDFKSAITEGISNVAGVSVATMTFLGQPRGHVLSVDVFRLSSPSVGIWLISTGCSINNFISCSDLSM